MNRRYPVVVAAFAIVSAGCPAQQNDGDNGAVSDTGVAQVDTSSTVQASGDTTTLGLGAQKGLVDDTVTRAGQPNAAARQVPGRPRPIPSEPRPGAQQ